MALTIPTDWEDRGSQYFSPTTKSSKGKVTPYAQIVCHQVAGDCTNVTYQAGSMVMTINKTDTDCTTQNQAVYAVRFRVIAGEFTVANLNLLSAAINSDIAP